uniref:Myelin protein zero like 3 n=1 Tax=Moschus moschiferus TaxID=68415 RepID=A0A8C6E664_MOSMO
MQQSGVPGSRGCALCPLLGVLFFQALTRRGMTAWRSFVFVVPSVWIQTTKRHIDGSLHDRRVI